MEAGFSLLLYFDKAHLLEDFNNECVIYLKQLSEKSTNNFLPLRCLIEVDVMKLIDEFPDLGRLLLEEPLEWQRTASNILLCLLKSMTDNSDYQIQPPQVAVTIRLKCLPKHLCRSNQRHYNGLVFFEGILLAISNPSTYVYHSVWCCPEECSGSEEILQYLPKSYPKCNVCRSVMYENTRLTRCGEQVNITFMLDNDILAKNFVITDDLIPKLREGTRYRLAGVIVKKTTTIWQVEEVNNLAAPLTTPAPTDIKKLFQDCDELPWKFIYCLASGIGVNVCSVNSFMHLKICLLLSLSSIKSNASTGSSILHIFAAGYDTSFVGNIMSEAAKMAETKVFVGTSIAIVSAALLSSSGGVCIMPLPFKVYKQKTTSGILSAVESGEILTDNGRVQLQTAVWAQGEITKVNAASVFGFFCRGDSGEYDEEIVDFLLQNAVNPKGTTEEEIEALKDVSKYIDLVSGLNVTLDYDTEKLLESYFLAARRQRPDVVTAGSMGALVTATLTTARLCRRSIANVNDAVFTIWLHITGTLKPRSSPEEYLQTPADDEKFHKIMINFIVWLEQFVG